MKNSAYALIGLLVLIAEFLLDNGQLSRHARAGRAHV